MTIEQLRLVHKNEIYLNIAELTRYNETDSKNILRFRSMKSDNYTKTQLTKLNSLIEKRENEIIDLNTRLEKIETGELDEELKNILKQNTQKATNKHNETISIKLQKKKEKEEDAKLSKDYHDRHRKNDYNTNKRAYESANRFYFKTVDKVPSWIEEKLQFIPYNQGIIFKGIYFFGKKNNKGSESIFTEYKKGSQTIHKWDNDYSYVYTKQSRSDPILLSKTPRKIKS